MKVFGNILFALLFVVITKVASAPALPTASETLDYWVSNAEKEVVSAAEAMPAGARSLREARDNFERAYILAELGVHEWNMTRTAERLGIERSHLYRKIKAYGITPPKD